MTKEQRLGEPVVKPATASEIAVDQLTKAFEKLSVNLLQTAQLQQPYGPQGGSYGRNPRYGQQLLTATGGSYG